jgi:hypothetical protein
LLVETGSVLMLPCLHRCSIGTLLCADVQRVGDRIGHHPTCYCAMRAVYATLATAVMTFAYTGMLTPVHVLVIAGLMGLVRPSDIGMRATLIGETIPAAQLMGAMSIQRTTQDSARIAGALTGAGLVAMLGMGPAYTVVASFYAISFVLTVKAGRAHTALLRGADAARVFAFQRHIGGNTCWVRRRRLRANHRVSRRSAGARLAGAILKRGFTTSGPHRICWR